MTRHTTLRLLAAALAAAVLCHAGAARAENELSVRVSTAFTGGGSGVAATGSSGALVEGELGYARLLSYLGPTRLWFEGNYMIARRSATTFGFVHELDLHRATAGVRLSLPIPRAPWLQPHVRVGVGVAAGNYRIGSIAGDWATAFTGHALGGFELLLPRAWMKRSGGEGFTMGFVVEGGLTYATALAFTSEPASAGDVIRTPTSGTPLGSLDLTAGVVRAGAVLWF